MRYTTLTKKGSRWPTISIKKLSCWYTEHRGDSHRIAAIQQELVAGKLISRDELLGFLNRWVAEQILGIDQGLGQHLLSEDYVVRCHR